MATGTFTAHERIVTMGRMYLHMVLIGLIIAGFIYAVSMNFLLSGIASKVPEYVNGKYVIHENCPKLPKFSLFKYYVSLDLQNYVDIKRPANWEPQERVEAELRGLLGTDRVSRDIYQQTILYVTNGRVEQLRWIIPVSLI